MANHQIDKQDALQDIVLIARNHQISADEIAEALREPGKAAETRSAGVLSKLFGYIGGIFVFAGIGVFISMYWGDFDSAARVIVTLGIGFAAFVMSVLCLNDQRYERAATPLLLISLVLQPMGIFVMLDEYASGGDPRHGLLFMAAFMLIQQGMTFAAKHLTVMAFATVLFATVFLVTLFDLWKMDSDLIGIVMGISLMCVAYALGKSSHLRIAAFWYLVGSMALLISIFDLLKGSLIEPLYLGISAFMIFISTLVRSGVLMLVGTLSMLCYIGYFTAEHFANTLGWPIALVIIGIAFIGISAMAVRLNNKYIKSSD
ncbi:MAG: DUF2157 domain-containing protein [Methylophilaceae bacterium]|nr:DUF2157 domain-containing protein [Methylophilaceae bacterium]